ncbi:elongation factor 1-gamma-like [Daphnia pulex]|uniref:elongation factor 1-gamma-like n=1 Tax=Daphnia pulex TaxID=6669 RepID=UPI001EDFAD79|nr:elongation factor 1-gamma-like [Daphnia pulex]XP_046648016.1 elongation factor 1-gamma-like [Daphnia pulicaria]
MASGTLYTYPSNFRANKALIAAQYSGFKINVASNFVFGETNKSETFLKKFPLGKVPAFESQDGQCIAESNAIAYFVANQQLRGNSDVEKAQVLQWMSFADSEILPLSCTIVFPVLGIIQYNKQAVEHAKEELKAILSVVNNHLLTRTFLVGEKITLADIVLSSNLLHLYESICDETNRKPYQNLNRWFITCVNQPQFKAIIGDFKICQKECPVDPKKFAEFQSKITGSLKKEEKKSVKDEKKKEKKEEKPKPKKEEPEEAEEMDAADAALLEEPKSKDPFDEMPKGTFNMDDFKRFYSNNEESKSIPYFWDKFDKENYSIWFGEYKYSDELTKVFMSCNLISGMYQRLDKMRKQCFASMCLFGTDNDCTISGIWVWRGQDLAFQLCPDWQIDYETYDWKKLNPDSDETKKMVAEYFAWSGTDKNGRPFNQGKIFK